MTKGEGKVNLGHSNIQPAPGGIKAIVATDSPFLEGDIIRVGHSYNQGRKTKTSTK